mmetsp:Transcript_14719/g.42117  ORF Transcript_14719/g.42117 Transcript_14719/m.42117 type:complete len:257 (+) Transcript_14719:1780-2550(+)
MHGPAVWFHVRAAGRTERRDVGAAAMPAETPRRCGTCCLECSGCRECSSSRGGGGVDPPGIARAGPVEPHAHIAAGPARRGVAAAAPGRRPRIQERSDLLDVAPAADHLAGGPAEPPRAAAFPALDRPCLPPGDAEAVEVHVPPGVPVRVGGPPAHGADPRLRVRAACPPEGKLVVVMAEVRRPRRRPQPGAALAAEWPDLGSPALRPTEQRRERARGEEHAAEGRVAGCHARRRSGHVQLPLLPAPILEECLPVF